VRSNAVAGAATLPARSQLRVLVRALRSGRWLLECAVIFRTKHGHTDMLELNPVRQRIADLKGRLDALRGYL